MNFNVQGWKAHPGGKPKYREFALEWGIWRGKFDDPLPEEYEKIVAWLLRMGTLHGHSPTRRRKGMSGTPTSVRYVASVRNAGWPTGRESQGHGVPMVVGGVTSTQGDGHAVHRAKQDRWSDCQ